MSMLINMSFTGAIMILAIIIVRALAINKLPKRTFSALWGITLVRLLVPFTLASPFSAYNLVRHTPQFSIQTGNIPPSVQAQYEQADVICMVKASDILTLIWLTGMIVCGTFFTVAYYRCRQEFKLSLPVQHEQVKAWLNGHKIKRIITVRQLSRISAPLTYGIIHPVILIPGHMNFQNTEQLNYVLTHEYIHIRRFDGAAKLLLNAALCIHWFNPLVWAMYILANRDMELSCDEAVIHSLGDHTKAAYALTLIDMEEAKGCLAPLCNNFSKNAIEERITAIMKTKRITKVSIALAFAIAIGMAGVFATSAVASDNQTETAFTSNHVDAALYSEYLPFGLTVNEQTGKLYYEDKLVRCFDDQFPANGFRVKGIGYYEETGVLDVRAVRDNSGFTSKLTGLEVLSPSEFEKRVINDPTKPASHSTTDMFQEYRSYGLSYDESQKALFYNGQRVRQFMDIRKSNGKPVDSKGFSGSVVSNLDAEGVIDVYAIRDESKTDKNGYGELTGLRVAEPEEFDAQTKAIGQNVRAVESAE